MPLTAGAGVLGTVSASPCEGFDVLRRLVLGLGVLVALGLGVVLIADDPDAAGIDVHDVAAAEPPPRDAVLEDAAWPEAAAWIRREVDDDRPVVMNVFASWCTPCKRELPVLNAAAEEHPDIAFVGIDHMDLRENAEAFVEEQEIAFPTLFDIEGDVIAAIGGRAMPTTAFFDADGRMRAMVSGELTERSLAQRLDEIR
jgi:thiol-disulfide isomerase/thioredoxin